MGQENALASLGYTWHKRAGGPTVFIPPLCTVPAGPFLMGSDPRRDPHARAEEQPAHIVTLPTYQIAQYPVTVAEYGVALAAGAADAQAPLDWDTQRACITCPVSGLTWHDALSYVRWLCGVTGRRWRLPAEAEWEKAARGPDGRIYPWGDVWEAGRGNAAGVELDVQGTTAVDAHPQGVSPYGVLDMVGNVAEWTGTIFYKSEWLAYSAPLGDCREGTAAQARAAVMHGGCWLWPPEHLRAAQRTVFDTADCFDWLHGLRLALDAHKH